MLQSNYYSVREIKLIASGGRGGGRLPQKVELYRCAGTGIRFSGVNFCLGIGLQEVTFVTLKVLGIFSNEKCITFD